MNFPLDILCIFIDKFVSGIKIRMNYSKIKELQLFCLLNEFDDGDSASKR